MLLVVVLALWGTVGCNILSYKERLNTPAIYSIRSNQEPVVAINDQESFDLLIDYRDPFIGNQRLRTSSAVSPKTTSSSRMNRKTEKIITPSIKQVDIRYRGYLLTEQQVTSVRLDVNGIANTYKIGATDKGFSIRSMARDSILVLFSDGTSTIIFRKR